MSEERVVPGVTSIHNTQKHIARYNLALEHVADKNVLDIACGSGYGTQLMSRVANHVTGVDISKYAIQHAIDNYSNENVDYEISDLLTYNPKSKFDVIVSFETLEHLHDTEQAQKHLMSLLNPGGFIIYSLPLNETPGQNEHHKHIFNVEQALDIFPEMEMVGSVIQVGVNFYTVNKEYNKPFSYLVSIKRLK